MSKITAVAKAMFGYTGMICSAEPGHSLLSELDYEGLYQVGIYYFFKGRVSPYFLDTKEVLPERGPGWLSTEHRIGGKSGTINVVFTEPTSWVCIAKTNNAVLPNVQSLVVDGVVFLPNGSNIYLVDGVLEINGKEFVGPTQIRVRSGDVTATSRDKAYCLKFL